MNTTIAAGASRERRARSLLLGGVALTVVGGAWVQAVEAGRTAGVPARAARLDDVVATVRARRADPGEARRTALRAALGRDPRDEVRAVALAQEHVAESRASGDPRELGRAEAVLAPWWELTAPPPAIWLLRATIEQSRHHFDGALADLDALLLTSPANESAQAWLTRAVVLGVQGRYADALASCAGLTRFGSPLTVAACRAPVLATTGRTSAAESALVTVLAGVTSTDARGWVHGLLGEIAGWRGDGARAETHLRLALDLAPTDRYVRTTLADLWLDQGRDQEVLALLAERERDDGALLRLALAGARLGSQGHESWREALRERFAAARARGEAVHAREESRAALGLEGDVARALALATENWQVQREPADARVLLEAALAARAKDAARPVLAWLAETGFEGARVKGLAAAIEALP